MKVYGVIMAGGGGTRFWPLSRADKPKQFLNLSGKNAMVVEAAQRLAKVADKEDIFVVTNVKTADATIDLTKDILKPDHILAEPSDPFIKDEDRFALVLSKAVYAAEETDELITVGIKPTYPATGYGYIKYNADDDNVAKKVYEFVEKPDLETASEYVDSGEYAWNSGMFIWKASTILNYFEKLLPDIYRYLVRIGDAMGTEREQQVLDELYPEIPKISIDYGIMERADKVLMLEGDFGWNDVGSFDAFDQIHERDVDGNVILSDVSLIDCDDSVFYSTQKGHLIAALGIKDIVVAHTDDVTLVCAKDRAQDIKLFSDKLKEEGKERYC